MDDDASVFANSMINMYGTGAQNVAREYAAKHKRSGDMESHALWLRVAEIIEQRQKHSDA